MKSQHSLLTFLLSACVTPLLIAQYLNVKRHSRIHGNIDNNQLKSNHLKILGHVLKVCICIFLIQSCAKESIQGCMDPQSDNFNPEATGDDGSCVYERDKVLGTYFGAIDCSPDLYDDNNFGVRIKISSKSKDAIIFELLCCIPELVFEGKVDGDKITINSAVDVSSYPRCDGSTPENGTPFKGSVSQFVDIQHSNGILKFTNWVTTYRNENTETLCLINCMGEFRK